MKPIEKYQAYPISVADIHVDKAFNCRGEFTPQSVKTLADSIQSAGLDYPITVRPTTKKPYSLVAGFRRFMACTEWLKWTEIPAYVRTDLDDYGAHILNYRENLDRQDLNLLEEARGIAHTFTQGESLRAISQAIGKPTRWVHARQRLLELPEQVQQKAAAGLLTAANIETIWNKPPRERVKAAERIAKQKERGKRQPLPPDCRGSFRYRKTKDQLMAMVAWLLDKQVQKHMPTVPRAIAWAAGNISDEEFREDIEAELFIQQRIQKVFNVCRSPSPKKA